MEDCSLCFGFSRVSLTQLMRQLAEEFVLLFVLRSLPTKEPGASSDRTTGHIVWCSIRARWQRSQVAWLQQSRVTSMPWQFRLCAVKGGLRQHGVSIPSVLERGALRHPGSY